MLGGPRLRPLPTTTERTGGTRTFLQTSILALGASFLARSQDAPGETFGSRHWVRDVRQVIRAGSARWRATTHLPERLRTGSCESRGPRRARRRQQ